MAGWWLMQQQQYRPRQQQRAYTQECILASCIMVQHGLRQAVQLSVQVTREYSRLSSLAAGAHALHALQLALQPYLLQPHTPLGDSQPCQPCQP
jgi:hypothetical protein